MKNPKVSVLMSVYNGEKFLEETMDSILSQTCQDWECIVIDDCSTDNTPVILAQYARRDKRICVYRNEHNQKLPASLNRALQLAKGTYIVRMDADDVCRRDRLEKQVAFMEKNPDLNISCCRLMALVGDDVFPTVLQRREEPEMVKALFLFFNPIIHPGVIARRAVMKKFGYRKEFTCTEDFDLWCRMICAGEKIAIQGDYLLLYRIHEKQVTMTASKEQKAQYRRIICPFYEKMMFPLKEDELDFLQRGIYEREILDIKEFMLFFSHIKRVNKTKKTFTKNGIVYAAFEVIMAYRSEFSLSKGEVFRILLKFPPGFLLKEVFRRKAALHRALDDCIEAQREFNLSFSHFQNGTGIPYYRRK